MSVPITAAIKAEALRRLGELPPHRVHEQPPSFDPVHVLRNRRSIARAISLALRSGRYSVEPPRRWGAHGTMLSIPDASVGRLYAERLRAKNDWQLGSGSAGFGRPPGFHEPVRSIAAAAKDSQGVYVAHADLRSCFRSIRHDQLSLVLRKPRFLVTREDLAVIAAFLRATDVRGRGLLPGTPLSRVLVDFALWPLDEILTRVGVAWTRIIDDVVMWSQDRSVVEASAEAVLRQSAVLAGGARLVTPIRHLAGDSVDRLRFAGYEISATGIGLGTPALTTIRRSLNHIVLRSVTLPGPSGRAHVDPAYVWLTGALHSKIGVSQSGRPMRSSVAGYFPLVDQFGAVRQLDGWLLSRAHSAMRRRRQLLGTVMGDVFPHSAPLHELTRPYSADPRSSIPSLVRSLHAASRFVRAHGLEEVGRDW